MSKSYAIFYSPNVKKGAQLSLLQDAFAHFNLKATFHPVQDNEKLASSKKADVLVAAGGDGTVNCVAAEAYKLAKPMAVVPLGTLNHFAKDMGLPRVLLQAVGAIAKGTTTKVDIGTVNDHVFLNNCSVGLYPALVRSRTRFEKYIGKWPAALISTALISRRRLHLYTIDMELDGKSVEKKSTLLFIGNNSYALDGVGLPARDTLRDGKLNVLVLRTKRVDRLVKTALYSMFGRKLPERYLQRYEAINVDVQVKDKKSVWVAYDGEVDKLSLPLKVNLHAKALTVVIPATT